MEPSKTIQGGMDIIGSFETLIFPIYPIPFPKLTLLLKFTEVDEPMDFEVRINAPDESLVFKDDFSLKNLIGDSGAYVVELKNFMIAQRGQYTIDVFKKEPEGKLRFIATENLFLTAYPPQRILSDEDKAKIMADDSLVKTVKTTFRPISAQRDINVQVNLDPNTPIEEGYLAIPANDTLIVDGVEYDMTGVRRQLEWMLGTPNPNKGAGDAPKADVDQESPKMN